MRHRSTAAPLGQHLLTNPAVAHKVARAASAAEGTRVFEVGPGKGMLTRELLNLGATVTAVEKDPSMVAMLEEMFADEIRTKKLKLITGDARQVTPDTVYKKGEYVIAANIPYYITGELLRQFLTAKNQPAGIALLVQKEVAERIARSKKESILSLSVKVYGTPRYVEVVKRGNFSPPPKVDSAILAITDISRKNFKTISEKNFFALVKAGFGQKRKTLAGNVRRALGIDLPIDKNVRAEDVRLPEWLTLAKKLNR